MRTKDDKTCKVVRSLLIACVCMYVSGCAHLSKRSAPRDDESKFKVSVRSDGKPVKDFSTPLVHRVSVSANDIDRYTKPRANGKSDIIVTFQPVQSGGVRNSVYGLKLLAISGAAGGGALGLQLNDIITAIGPAHAKKPEDFQRLFALLRKEKTVSVTLVRSGKPHKILYYLES